MKIKIIIDQEFALETLALGDTGADRNIIRECLIPMRFYKKTTQALNTPSDQKLKIKYKLSNVVVCIEDTCFYITFILIPVAGAEVILRNPFTALLEPFIIDDI